jgi:phosphoethanolamine N-methyltransferase
MYLNDFEIQSLVEKCLRSMKSDGFLFFRESCFHASGNIKKVDKHENPTNYRSPAQYIDTFLSKVIEVNGENYGFELIFARPNRTYIEVYKNFDYKTFLKLSCKIKFFFQDEK